LLGKLDLLNIELIEATLDSLDKENLVKGTYYNVTGTKYVQKSELSALFSLHFNEMKNLKSQLDFPFREDISGVTLNQFHLLDDCLALVRGFDSELPGENPDIEANKECHVKNYFN